MDASWRSKRVLIFRVESAEAWARSWTSLVTEFIFVFSSPEVKK